MPACGGVWGFNVGSHVLGSFVVTLDQRSRVVRVARESRAPGPAPPALRLLGFRVAMPAGRMQVTDVFAGSAGERAGVRVGDEVVSVDGRAAAGMSRDEWNALSASTTPLHLVFRRDGAERTVAITPEVIVP
jgi:S1-C subfamily serine protease